MTDALILLQLVHNHFINAGGHTGAVEASGVVQPGDRVVGINGQSTAGLSYAEVLEILDEAIRRSDSLRLRFAPAPRPAAADGGAAAVMETKGRAKKPLRTRGVF